MKKVAFRVLIPLIVIAVALIFTDLNISDQDMNTINIKALLSGFGVIKASCLFLGIYTFSIRPFIPVPPSLYTVAGGLVFGPFLGTAFLDRLLEPSIDSVTERFSRPGFKTILILRSVPVGPPFDLISYGAGFLNVSFVKYFFATLLGIIPATLLFSMFGDLTTRGGLYLVSGFLAIVVISFLLPWLLKTGNKFKIRLRGEPRSY